MDACYDAWRTGGGLRRDRWNDMGSAYLMGAVTGHRKLVGGCDGEPRTRPDERPRSGWGMPAPRHHQVIVIGAGIAGLTAARALQAQGCDVAVLEKSRGYGGRAASRTVHGARIDHGAQFVTARDPRFVAQVEAWLADGTMVRWTHGLPSWTAVDGWREASAEAHPRFVSPDGMSSLGKALAQDVAVTREAHVTRVRSDGGAWCAQTRDGERWSADRVIVSTPLPQTLALLADGALPPALRSHLAAIDYAPCHALAAGYTGVTKPAWPGVRLPEHPDLAWVANDTSRRRDTRPGEVTLMLHATPAFTRRRYDDTPDAIASALLSIASALVPWALDPRWTYHQRWRYAQPERTLPEPALAQDGLVVCGDAFGDGRVEGAYLSGLAAAECVALGA